MNKTNTQDNLDWLEIFKDWEQSRLTIDKYCQSHKLNKNQFSMNRRRYIKKGLVESCQHNPPCHRGKKQQKSSAGLSGTGFIPISSIPVSDSSTKLSNAQLVEISLPNGILLRIPTNVSC